jgi:hypothetical protein
MTGTRRGRGGWLLVEVVVAMALGVVMLGVVAATVRATLVGARIVSSRVEALEAVRTTWVVLEEELGKGRPCHDWHLADDGAVALRAFRGFGRVCDSGLGTLQLAYRGRRLPEVDRDSLLVLTTGGAWIPASLQGVVTGSECPLGTGERSLTLTTSTAWPSPPVLVRVFERGSYHLTDGALRYRRGAGGRQPLTLELFAPASRFERTTEGVVAHVEIEGDVGVGPFSWRLPEAP